MIQTMYYTSSDNLNIYLFLSLIVCVLFPFTGMISLYHSINARRFAGSDRDEMESQLDKAYKWCIISFLCLIFLSVSILIALIVLYKMHV